MLRRLKKDVIKELPTKSERILRVEMSQLQVCLFFRRWSRHLKEKYVAGLVVQEYSHAELCCLDNPRHASIIDEHRHGTEESQ